MSGRSTLGGLLVEICSLTWDGLLLLDIAVKHQKGPHVRDLESTS